MLSAGLASDCRDPAGLAADAMVGAGLSASPGGVDRSVGRATTDEYGKFSWNVIAVEGLWVRLAHSEELGTLRLVGRSYCG